MRHDAFVINASDGTPLQVNHWYGDQPPRAAVMLAHGMAERPQKLILLLDQVQRRTPCRARPEPRQFRQKLDEFLDFGAGDSFCHGGVSNPYRRETESPKGCPQ